MVLGLVVLASAVQAQQAVPANIAAFGKNSDQVLFQKNHLYVFNGTTSVGLNPDHFGVHRLVAPPYIANPFSADLQMFGQNVSVHQYNWYPSESLFLGQVINGIEPQLQVVPLKSQRGALVTLTLLNTTSKQVTVSVKWSINGGPDKSLNWRFGVFRSSSKKRVTTTLENNAITKLRGDARLIASLSGMDGKAEDHSLSGKITIAPGKAVKQSLILVVGDKEKVNVAETKAFQADPNRLVQETRSYWAGLFEMSDKRMPTLTGASPELQAFYRAGVISFLSTRHEVPEFLFNPFYATCGIDGGAANCYLWDTSYTALAGAMLAPKNMRNLITQFFKLDINRCYAFDPIYGKPQGPRYSYNYYNLARLVYTYLAVTGDFGLMEEQIDGKPALTCLYEACLGFEDLSKPPTLLDYGSNRNLLELKRTENYTHVTPSPNGERILTYRYLTEIYQALGRKTPHDLIQRGEMLKKLYVQKLWNDEKQWLNTLDEKGSPRIAYSIQIFDVLRTGMLNEQQEKGILSHLNEKEFLSEWGVHSLAKTDPGYDPRDVDWGGPGAYSGDPTELVVDLCQAGYAEQGVDVLNRILWWGELPYLPQAMRANKKGYREDGRSNLVSGGSTCHAVINGLFGICFDLNKITIKPINHPMIEGLSLKGVHVRNRNFDISVNGGNFTVSSDGKVITKKLGESVILLLEFDQVLKDSSNIVFILADDMGYNDAGCYGQTMFQTPNIDRLAEQGMRFTQFYAGGPYCNPSRSVLLTGQHMGHTRVRGNGCITGGIVGFSGTRRMNLTDDDVTVGHVLQQAGYRTGWVGKVHVDGYDPGAGPLDRGFDEFYGWLLSEPDTYLPAERHYYPSKRFYNRDLVVLEGNQDGGKEQHMDDLNTQDAINFIQNHQDEPFFLYVAYTIPHKPLDFPNFGPYADKKDWSDDMKLYAAMMDQLDQNVGIITQKLEDLQIDDNTLVIFCSDNGPWGSKHIRPFDSNGPLRGYKGDIYEGGIRVPMIARWPGQIPAGKVSNAIAYFADIFPTLADLAGSQTPENIDGISILPTLQGRPQPQLNKRFLYWGNYVNSKRDLQQAARRGNYKAIRMGLQKPMELYDLSVDIGEQNDIASTHPDIVKEFEEYFETDYVESPEWPVPFP